jgi:hypothetical protein
MPARTVEYHWVKLSNIFIRSNNRIIFSIPGLARDVCGSLPPTPQRVLQIVCKVRKIL